MSNYTEEGHGIYELWQLQLGDFFSFVSRTGGGPLLKTKNVHILIEEGTPKVSGLKYISIKWGELEYTGARAEVCIHEPTNAEKMMTIPYIT